MCVINLKHQSVMAQLLLLLSKRALGVFLYSTDIHRLFVLMAAARIL